LRAWWASRPEYLPPAEFTAYAAKDWAFWGKVISDAGKGRITQRGNTGGVMRTARAWLDEYSVNHRKS